MSLPFLSKLRNKRAHMQLVESELKEIRKIIAQQVECFETPVRPYMSYLMKGQGKMIRPGLVLLTAAATGGIKPKHRTFAAMLELLHTATLVHDDVLDKADTRRDIATPNALWGNNLAILLGDTLLAQTMIMGADLGDSEWIKRMALIVRDPCQGEVEQSTRLWDAEMTREDYYRLIRMKTATLFSAATAGAARLQGMEDEAVEQMEQMGVLLGTAYQIYDDCLDISGLDAAAGKTLGTDALKGKLTLPIFHLMESQDLETAQYVKGCIREKQPMDFERLRHTEAFADALRLTIEQGVACNESALKILYTLPTSPARTALEEMMCRLNDMLLAQQMESE